MELFMFGLGLGWLAAAFIIPVIEKTRDTP
jgi:hypothetical protein